MRAANIHYRILTITGGLSSPVASGGRLSRNAGRPQEFRERLELHLFHLGKHGLVGHLERRGYASFGGMKAHTWGLLTHARHVDREFALPLLERFEKLDWPT
jgi:hypothetical protein